MIYFPPPLPDELLYSVLARYHARSGNESTKKTMRDIFNKQTVCAVADLPSHLMQLYSLIPGKAISVDKLLDKLTLLPYFKPFIPIERYNWVYEEMLYGDGQSIYMKMGFPASGVCKPAYLRYCPACIGSDREKYGIAYWHRVHQLTGVSVCPLHNVTLSDSSILFSQRKNKHEFVMLESVLRDEQNLVSFRGVDKEFLIATRSAQILKMNSQPLIQEGLRNIYLRRLAQRGMLTAKGNIRFQELLPDFITFYGLAYLDKLGCSIDEDSQFTWLHKMLRKPRHVTHPLRHILLQIFLEIEMKDILEGGSTTIPSPFGDGPWPCLNKAATHFREKIIADVVVSRCSDTGKPVGTFSCSCGFVYSRRGPDSDKNDEFRIGRIKQFGSVWVNKLEELNNGTLGLCEKARRLGVDPGTIKNQNEILKLRSTVVYDELKILIKPVERKAKEHTKRRTDKKYIRVDWTLRDTEFVQEIDRVANKIRESSDRSLSRNEVGRLLHRSTMLRTKLEKLPCTSERLHSLRKKRNE
ncbi:hypothetical protein BSK62_25250 [Paenibacillus odorifer]|uniref:TnsD family Tn7-like transposition protein n=1 Tax=Paenibacillus odorifer TaxID=189426 RepID=UPI00096E98F4|nr:TnsD family Tn7-like transposition protein [Paenibacillus odorifer]OMD60669.1 hypothetical protein BSK62_25250 [Paenibacillus odorifer]